MHLLELIPRDLEQLRLDARTFMTQFSLIKGINIPDIKQLDIRSVTVAASLLSDGIFVVPHIRARDYSIQGHFHLIQPLVDLGLQAILIIEGDSGVDVNSCGGVSSVSLIKSIKQQFSHLNVYGALDPYRSSFDLECQYCQEKLDVGADGFFTQPFFDSDQAKRYLDYFCDTIIFLGLSPVLTEKSQQYWERVNKVVFPKEFELTLDYNVMLNQQLIKLADLYKQHIYMMPIKMDVALYLGKVYGKSVIA